MSVTHDEAESGRAPVVTLRAPAEAMDQATRLQPELSRMPEYAGLRLSAAAILRLAMFLGLGELERRRRAAAGEASR